MRKKTSYLANINPWIVCGYLLLLLLGWLNLYATTYTEELTLPSYQKQLIWIAASFILALIILTIDANFYESFANIIYIVFMVTLLAVLVFGASHKGARSWFNIGSFAFQPTEFAKFATALFMAKFLSNSQKKINHLKTFMNVAGIIFLPMLLISLQPDPGSAIVFIAFYFALYREGFPGWILAVGFLAVSLFLLTIYLQSNYTDLWGLLENKLNTLYIFMCLVPFIVYRIVKAISSRKTAMSKKVSRTILWALVINVFMGSVSFIFNSSLLKDRHRNRVNEMLGITHDPSGVGYNVHQSKIAIGSGGFWGKGFLDGTQTKYDFVPEQRTDFIFCTVGEEWGFVGTTLVIIIYLLLIMSIIQAAERQKAAFSRIYGYCVASLFFFHFAINIGMTIGLVPVIGIPLPFFSYGGSSLWAFTILLFIFIRLDAERKFIL